MIRPDRVPFFSYPYEWCFGQLQAAALLTLDIQRKALARSMSLKDASAFNVQFVDGRPVFIDSLSFESYREGSPWVAYRQFCRHFLAPLALMSQVDVRLNRVVPAQPGRHTPRPGEPDLALEDAARPPAPDPHPPSHQGRAGPLGRFRPAALDESPALLQDGAARPDRQPRRRGPIAPLGAEAGPSGPTITPRPTIQRRGDHSRKLALVGQFLDETRPRSVWDLGANTGRYSRLAADRGASTVAFDVDPACVELHYREIVARQGIGISCRSGWT